MNKMGRRAKGWALLLRQSMCQAHDNATEMEDGRSHRKLRLFFALAFIWLWWGSTQGAQDQEHIIFDSIIQPSTARHAQHTPHCRLHLSAHHRDLIEVVILRHLPVLIR